ncbi:sensor histidine kinase [Aliikangiella maris]|uniref:histidine kinase n=2 Tax=Aliikangiella maris TaxID=3162458 RepID=A0ABV3MPL5_9GAMM
MSKRRPFELQLIKLTLIPSIVLLSLTLSTLYFTDISIWLIILTLIISCVVIIYTSYQAHQKLVYQFRSLDNLLDALIKGDYSLRARADNSSGELSDLITSINSLAERLSHQRRISIENQFLVRTVIEHIDVAIIALNQYNQISFYNPAAERLLQLQQSNINQQLLEQLSFVQSLHSGHHEVVELKLGKYQGKFNVHIEEFRESGEQHKLLFITDVRTLLRSEERKAWQKLVRVISHEINNSLSPIASISQTLNKLVSQSKILSQGATFSQVERQSQHNQANELKQDLTQGLKIISQRANSLSNFVNSYKQLTSLPAPNKSPTSIKQLVDKSISLFKHYPIEIKTLEDCIIEFDSIQLEQVMINLIKNAIESMQPLLQQTNHSSANSNSADSPKIEIEWYTEKSIFKLFICDQGSGISNPDNLFIPFYSTKKNGSGIGLVLCRQIIEAHDGYLSLQNRKNCAGCVVCIEIPIIE